MSQVTINGKTYVGNSISIINGVVKIDGVLQDGSEKLSGIVELKIEGNINSLHCEAQQVNVNGNIGELNASGSVKCQNVTGNVDAGGSISCGDVGGKVDAGGSVNAGKVNGNVRAGGSVNHR